MSQSKTGVFSEVEKEAMRARAKELRDEAKATKNREEGEKQVLAAIAEMTGSDKAMATRIHELVKEVAPQLSPKTWYGMPAYANKDGKAVCFFKAAGKYEERYATLGFNDVANIDEGNMWVTSFGLVKISPAEEKIIKDLVKKAVS
jgi:uncharacterized protein YdhG (YjbR/CyaY superfamily)